MRFTHNNINFDITCHGHQCPQNVHKIYFQTILITFICDIKIGAFMYEPHFVKLFFVNILHCQVIFCEHPPQLVNFLTSEIPPLVIVKDQFGGGGSKGSYEVNGYM